ncbi:MAG: hypothetical protein KBA66_05190 [Leptospiraceae bacterium]|nr:hypothetical protein [Leptospiraceae bacterium]
MNYPIRLLILGLIFLFLGFCKSEKPQKNIPKAVKGILDLSQWDFEKDGVINLDGEWEFYWNELVIADGLQPIGNNDNTKYIPVPSQWQNEGYPAYGYATYRLQILLPVVVGTGRDLSLQRQIPMSIAMTNAATAYAMYINGKLASVNGKVGKSKEESEPFLQYRTFSIDSFLNNEVNPPPSREIEIIIQVSNYHHFKSGLWDIIKIGVSVQLEQNAKQKFVMDLILFSSLFIMGWYHFGLYLNRRKDMSALYFGIFCILIGLRTICFNERMILDVFPFFPFLIVHKLEFLSFYYASFIFIQFLRSLFPEEFSKRWFVGFAIILLPCSLFVIFFPINLYTRVLTLVQITILLEFLYAIKVLISAVLHKQLGAKLFLVGFTLFGFAITNDILRTMGILFNPYMTSYGLLTFIIFQATVLSKKFAGAFTESEKLAEELKIFSEGLEEKVKDRTHEIEKQKEETEKLNELMKNINSVSSLTDIMSFLMYYLETEYKFNDFCLQIKDDSEQQLVTFSYTSSRNTTDERDYFMNQKILYRDLSGVFAEVFETKKLVFVRKENITEDDIIAKDWIENGRFDYLLLLPLVIYDELIGILFLHSALKESPVTEEILLKLERFSDLIAGSIFNAKLLKKVEEAKEIAVISHREAETERSKSEKLLLNILPKDVAEELKEKGVSEPVFFESVSVLFTDFKGFTTIAETLPPQKLVQELDQCFSYFDSLMERYGLEKLKTIGDSYMCAGGIPRKNTTHAVDCVLAALEIQSIMRQMKELKEIAGQSYWELRLGIHSGSLVAGVIGEKKFAYDVWGDTVNTASRMESSGTPGKINISGATYALVKDFFDCEFRGKVNAKNKGEIDMYYVNGLKMEYSKEGDKKTPNGTFWKEVYGR